MSKEYLFNYDFRKGTLIESASNTVGTPTTILFKKESKGLSTYYSGTSKIDSNLNPSLTTFTLECWLKTSDVTTLQNIGANAQVGSAINGFTLSSLTFEVEHQNRRW